MASDNGAKPDANPVPSAPSESSLVPTMLVLMASLGFGSVPFFAKNLLADGMSPVAIAFFRFSLVALVTLPSLKLKPHQMRATFWGMGAGFAMGAGWIAYVSALNQAPVATVGVLYMTYPIFTLVTGKLIFGENPSGRAMIAAVLILAGAVISSTAVAIDPAVIPSLVLAMAAPISFGIAINILTHTLTAIPPVARLSAASLGTFIALAPLLLFVEPSALTPATSINWLLVVGIAVCTAGLPQLIYVINAPKIGAPRAAMCGSIELPAMFAVGWLAFGEALGTHQLLAGALIVIAIVMTPSRAVRNVANNLANAERPAPP